MTEAIGVNDFEDIRNAEPDEHGIVERPVLPLRGMVVYPNIVAPISLSDTRALAAARYGLDSHKTVIALTMRDSAVDSFSPENLYTMGTEIALGRLLPMPHNQNSILVQGRRRLEIIEFVQTTPHLIARARLVEDFLEDDAEADILAQTVANLFQHAVDLNDNLPEEIVNYALSIDDYDWLADFVSSTLTLPLDERQRVLEMTNLNERLRHVAMLLSRELNMLELKDEINGQVQQEMARSQREIYLREQMRVIQSELGEEDIFQQEINEIRDQIIKVGLPAEVFERANREVARLAMMPPLAPEVGIIRTYLDWLVSLPWSKSSTDNLDLKRAQYVLDEHHHGLSKIKDRILEHIAVRKLAPEKMRSPILCFVGPPGVGKTSLGQSIAAALGREFVRVSLGGVRDEAEIRGHRRTYIGAMPGRVIQTMRRAGTINPVFILDEIDKLGADFRGDPAAALLEVLDPEQNREYSDHYLEVPYDLSKVMFITTANDLFTLPPALLDRLEVIEFPGYTEEEKLDIAREFLLPKQLEAHGLDKAGIVFTTPALETLIRDYTYEAGVRNLDREIANVCRKTARLLAEDRKFAKRITPAKIVEYLGPPEYIAQRANDQDSVGVATGLAWTTGGGDILTIEVSILPGKGTLTLTGQLGEVMQESAQAAHSYMRWRAAEFDVPSDDFENYDVHVHLPEGAVPKDGPSAGITLATAIISAFTERPISSAYAMTGEITLRGKVLPVGGVKEKVLAARRARLKNIILPAQNRKDLVDIPSVALRDMNVIFVDDMQQVLDLVLLPPPPDGRMRDRDRDDDDKEPEKLSLESDER
ncbi:MAG: endopeptidase La [bacterium]|nr:endopeptidase La [bacterium]